MKYYEITMDTSPELLDSRCEALTDFGISGFVVESEEDFRNFLENNTQYWDYVDEDLEKNYSGKSRIKFWLNDDCDGKVLLSRITAAYPECTVASVQDSDWENNWREFYKPIPVGERLVVVPEWESVPEDGRIPLILDPGLIFGTGSHATTRMCLAELENWSGAGKRVLDLGCGSGILGIGALNLGCEYCVSVDIDPKAPDVVMSNAALNPSAADKVKALAGDVIGDTSLVRSLGSGYHLVLANIVADVIIALAPKVRAFMAEDAVFICSGIIDGREDEVEKCLQKNGFLIRKHNRLEGWNSFVCQ